MRTVKFAAETPRRANRASWRTLVGAMIALVSLCFSLPATAADAERDVNPGVVRPDDKVAGKSYSHWAGAWWAWAVQYPLATNPIVDPTGAFNQQGQSGPVFFLAGNFGGTSVRSVTIPPGKHVFLPLYNFLWWTPEDAATLEGIRAIAVNSVKDATLLEATLDGVRVIDPFAYRASSGPGGFAILFLPNSLGTDFGYAPGVRDPAISDGYWLMLKPLRPGKHTLNIKAQSATGFDQDVTYHITVVKP